MLIHKNKSFFSFSEEEIKHLLMAWFAISVAFALISIGGIQFSMSFLFIIYFIISAITVGIGFLFHELAHKFVAQKYGCWAEFRSNPQMLLVAVAMSAFAGFLFAAPGAVLIYGHVTKEKNGKISVAGPVTNLVIAFIFLIFSSIFPWAIVRMIASRGFQINAWLALFNLIPFGNFDGRKILDWNKFVYFSILAISFALTFLPI